MINKKLLLAAWTLVSAVSTSPSFAKTQGNYAGIDLLATKYKSYLASSQRESKMEYGIGLNYKYAINFDHFFISPGVFYNFNNADVNSGGTKDELKYSYGVKADLGYDITNIFAPFVTFGYQENRRELKDFNAATSAKYISEAFIYGVGVKYSVLSNVDVSLAYEYVDYNNNPTNSLNVDVVKLGASFKF